MKLIVNIPCYNEEENLASVIKEIPRSIEGLESVEVLVYDDGSTDGTAQIAKSAGADYVISHKKNKGLAATFKDAIWEAVVRGADIIVNTDGDNHYDQSKIATLIEPILKKQADIVIGSRKNLNTKNKNLNKFGSFVMTKWAGMPKYDVSTGFRAYNREAALKIGIYSPHTYCHTTLFSAQDLNLTVKQIAIADRPVSRPSRLIKNVPDHIWKAGWNIVGNVVIFRSMRFFGFTGALLLILGLYPMLRFAYYYIVEQGNGHIQSLIVGSMLMMIGYLNIVLGLLGSSIGWSRKVSEEALYRIKKIELDKNKEE
ncbi:MAG: glycosyltransferase family 2 protein [Patescibacteria group bacterium]